ncbi:unnamed protein product [Prunus brigantina]
MIFKESKLSTYIKSKFVCHGLSSYPQIERQIVMTGAFVAVDEVNDFWVFIFLSFLFVSF